MKAILCNVDGWQLFQEVSDPPPWEICVPVFKPIRYGDPDETVPYRVRRYRLRTTGLLGAYYFEVDQPTAPDTERTLRSLFQPARNSTGKSPGEGN